jgi:lipid-A-disaccharide synthase
VWAWKKGRIAKLAEYCRKMLVIFPFETEVYEGSGLETEFVGHPLVDVVRERSDPNIVRADDLMLLLPGSRSNEINRLFIPMLETAMKLRQSRPELRFAVAAARPAVKERLEFLLDEFKSSHPEAADLDLKIESGKTGELLQRATAGLAASGTVTVECAIAGLPLVVVYKLNPITFFLAKMVVDIPFFTMANIIAGKLLYEEYLQKDVNAANLAEAVGRILPGGDKRGEVLDGVREVRESLTVEGTDASAKTAETILRTIYEVQ